MAKWEEETQDWLFQQGVSEAQIENVIDILDAEEEKRNG